MKKICAFLLLMLLASNNICLACTTFFIEKNGQKVFGKNYDWVTGTGMINTNLRGLLKTSLAPDGSKTTSWVSKYGSITFNQYGKEFPNGGMNEKGLVVELMWLNESQYPSRDSRPAISVLQWIQYQLDNCATVDEVIATDTQLRIASTGTPQHYLVADSKGGVATIEFLNGKMVVHKGNELPYPVLANSTYSSSIRAVKSAPHGTAQSFNDNSIERFANACTMVQQYKQTEVKKPLVDYSFDILNKVASGSFTKWSIVYDITNKQIHFKTLSQSQVKSFGVANFNYACNAKPVSFNMNQSGAGNINSKFSSYLADVNSKILNSAFNESKSRINVDDDLIRGAIVIAESVKCK